MAHPLLEPDGRTVRIQQVSLFLGDQYVISFHHGKADPFEPVRKRLRSHIGRLRERGADSLLQALIDLVIDSGFPVLERVSDALADLEEEMLETPTSEHLRHLYELKRTLVFLRRMLWPQREVVNRLVRGELSRISESTRIYFSDCYDHTIQIMDLVESYRDMATGLLDVYLSSVSYRMNEIMRVLTVISTIFIPLTFLTGVYGMNFGNDNSPWAMPELRWYYGYPLVWLVIIVIAVGMLAYFRRRKWF
jgi:magnesium transporter